MKERNKEETLKKISERLNILIEKSGKSIYKIEQETHINHATFRSWLKGSSKDGGKIINAANLLQFRRGLGKWRHRCLRRGAGLFGLA